jgi:hypothetical protein
MAHANVPQEYIPVYTKETGMCRGKHAQYRYSCQHQLLDPDGDTLQQ